MIFMHLDGEQIRSAGVVSMQDAPATQDFACRIPQTGWSPHSAA